MLYRKYGLLLVMLFLLLIPGCSTSRNTGETEAENSSRELISGESEAGEWEKGYDLPVEDEKKEEVREECAAVMEALSGIYEAADKGDASNAVLPDETLEQMQQVIGNMGYPVITSDVYCVMENYEIIDRFLKCCSSGSGGDAVLYILSDNGGVKRREYIFDGEQMYVISAGCTWSDSDAPIISDVSCTRISQWTYTEKGWFACTLCVPEPPEVSEIVNDSELIRVIPMPELYREISEKYLLPLGYRGNNLLCSDWSAEDPGGIDYNGVFEYFYEMEYGGVFPMERYRNGVPAEEFEALMMEYLPVDAGQLREWAAYDEESGTYAWNRLGCGNYSPSYFGTSVPEVTDLRENEDGTVTLTVEAVCGMVIADDAVITHEVTMRFEEDGSFQYLGNRILDDGIQNIPGYSYRISSRFPDQTTQIK